MFFFRVKPYLQIVYEQIMEAIIGYHPVSKLGSVEDPHESWCLSDCRPSRAGLVWGPIVVQVHCFEVRHVGPISAVLPYLRK